MLVICRPYRRVGTFINPVFLYALGILSSGSFAISNCGYFDIVTIDLHVPTFILSPGAGIEDMVPPIKFVGNRRMVAIVGEQIIFPGALCLVRAGGFWAICVWLILRCACMEGRGGLPGSY